MKAQLCESQEFSKNGILGGVRKTGKVSKQKDQEEIQIYLDKLKELVPSLPRNKKVSKLEIINNVIDYICDLQMALESHSSGITLHSPVSSPASSNSPSSVRQPLGVISSPNTSLTSTCGAQETNQQDKLTTFLDEVNTRPVSC